MRYRRVTSTADGNFWFVVDHHNFPNHRALIVQTAEWCRDNFTKEQWKLVDDEWFVLYDEVSATAFRLRWC